jgi:hypothetical protein
MIFRADYMGTSVIEAFLGLGAQVMVPDLDEFTGKKIAACFFRPKYCVWMLKA